MAIDIDKIMDYEAYYAEYVGKATVHVDQLTGLCPFHEESDPSFGVNIKTGQWICRAGCGSGNVITFHARANNLSENAALEDLYRKYSNSNNNKSRSGRQSSRQSDFIPAETLAKLQGIPAIPLKYVIDKRGWSEAIIKKYQIGFVSDGKRPAFAIPVFDEQSRLVNIRTYAPETRVKIKSWGKGFGSSRLYPLSVLDEAREAGAPVVLCEGEPDTLCGLSHGLFCITQTTGASSWWDPFNALFKGLDVIIAYDNDDAGRNGAKYVCRNLPLFAKSVSVVIWPEWMQDKEDLTDWFVRYGKSADEFMALPTDKTETGTEDDCLQKMLDELNQHHAVVMVGGRCVVINEYPDPTFGGISISYSKPEDFKNYYLNKKVWIPCGEGRSKQVNIGKVWLEYENRRQYKGIIFNPRTSENNGYYNLFNGFAFEPKKGDWSLFRNHIFNVIANHDKERFAYLIAWMAHTVQCCGDHRPGVAIVLRGGQGAGKGCFATLFGDLFGNHFRHIWQNKQFTGNFNQHLKDALVVFIDEGFWAGDKQSEGILRALISEDRLSVEPKGKDLFFVRSFMRIIIASNNQWVVPAGLNERRFCTLNVSDAHQQDKSYFNAIFEQMQAGGYSAMLHDLLEVDISQFDLSEFPRTDALFDQVYYSMSNIQKFWFEKLRSYSLQEETPYKGSGWPRYFVTANLHNEYLSFCQSYGDRHPLSDRAFSKELKRMCSDMVRVRRNPDNTARVWCLEVPPLQACRDKFQVFVGKIPVDWEDENEADYMVRDGPKVNENANLSHVSH